MQKLVEDVREFIQEFGRWPMRYILPIKQKQKTNTKTILSRLCSSGSSTALVAYSAFKFGMKAASGSEASGSCDASQLSVSLHETTWAFRIGSFNVGMMQDMLTSRSKEKYMNKVEDIITTCVQ